MPRCLPMLTSFFDRFWMGFCSQLRPPEPHGSSPRCSESTIFQKIAFRNWHRFLIDFGANLAPFCLPKSTKILSKIDPKMQQFFDRFLHRFFIDFWSILEPNLGPCWPLFRLKRGAAVRVRPLFCCVTFFESIFFRNVDPFWLHVAPFWCQVGSILAPCCCHFGAKLAVSWATWPHELALDGLVGLREASRISISGKRVSIHCCVLLVCGIFIYCDVTLWSSFFYWSFFCPIRLYWCV